MSRYSPFTLDSELAADWFLLTPLDSELAADWFLLTPLYSELTADWFLLTPLDNELAADWFLLTPLDNELAADWLGLTSCLLGARPLLFRGSNSAVMAGSCFTATTTGFFSTRNKLQLISRLQSYLPFKSLLAYHGFQNNGPIFKKS